MSETAFEQTSLFGPPVALEEIRASGDGEAKAEVVARDARQMAFSYVGRGAAALLRSSFRGERYRTAAAVYGALADLASSAAAQGRGTTAEFRASRAEVASCAGVSISVVVRYARRFERLELLKVDRPRGGRDHRTNLWRLLQVDGDARGSSSDTPKDSGRSPAATPSAVRGGSGDTPVVKEESASRGGNVFPLRDRSARKAGRDFSHFDQAMHR